LVAVFLTILLAVRVSVYVRHTTTTDAGYLLVGIIIALFVTVFEVITIAVHIRHTAAAGTLI
jgi:cell division protein FtsW (lipid II flippase)